MIYKDQPNGDRFYATAFIPKSLEGFTQDIGNPNLWHKNYLICSLRMIKDVKLRCGKIQRREWCSLKTIQVDPKICENCIERKEDDRT